MFCVLSVSIFFNIVSKAVGCSSAITGRLCTCPIGYYATQTNNLPSVFLGPGEVFAGCSGMLQKEFFKLTHVLDLNECAVYPAGPKAKCVNSALNERTITCDPGYAATLPLIPVIVLKGNEFFAGCTGKFLKKTWVRIFIC